MLTAGQDGVGRRAPGQPVSRPVTAPTPKPQPTPVNAVSLTKRSDLGGHPDTVRAVTDRRADRPLVTAPQGSLAEATGQPVTDRDGDRRPDLDTEGLLKIARQAVGEEDKLTRRVVAEAIRGQQIPLSSATLTHLMAQLREQHGQPVTADRN